jgi:hypothetical protein
MIRMPSIEQANERRILGSMQTYLEGEERCGLKWISGIIGPEIPLARKLLLARFTHYKNTPRYCDLGQLLLSEPFEFSCECDRRYLLFCRAVDGPLHIFPCLKCEWNQPIAGEIVAAFRLNEDTWVWEAVSVQPMVVSK